MNGSLHSVKRKSPSLEFTPRLFSAILPHCPFILFTRSPVFDASDSFDSEIFPSYSHRSQNSALQEIPLIPNPPKFHNPLHFQRFLLDEQPVNNHDPSVNNFTNHSLSTLQNPIKRLKVTVLIEIFNIAKHFQRRPGLTTHAAHWTLQARRTTDNRFFSQVIPNAFPTPLSAISISQRNWRCNCF